MGGCDHSTALECQLHVWLWRTVPLILVVIGTLGNVLSVFILSRPRLRKFAVSMFLMGLSVSDTTFLWAAVFIYTLETGYGFQIRSHIHYWCIAQPLIAHTTGCFSVWMLVFLTIERLLSTIAPMQMRNKMTRKSAIIQILTALVLCVAFSAHFIFGNSLQTVLVSANNATYNTTACKHSSREFEAFYTSTFRILTLIVMNTTPMLIILTGNITIAVCLAMQKRKLRKLVPIRQGASVHLPVAKESNSSKSCTKLLFLVSGMFLLATLPISVHRVLVVKMKSSKTVNAERIALINTVCYMILFFNFTFNFELYLASSTMFKKEWNIFLRSLQIKFRKLGSMFTLICPNRIHVEDSTTRESNK